MTQLTVFLDVGGVINDKDQLATQWQRLVGDCPLVIALLRRMPPSFCNLLTY